jgi:hypothetical protein
MSWLGDVLNSSAQNTPFGPGGIMGSPLFTGKGTPWGAPDQKGFGALQDPVSRAITPQDGQYGAQALGRGALGSAGMIPDPAKPDMATPKAFNPNDYAASDYGDFTRAGQDQINTNAAQNKMSLQAALAQGGGINSASFGAGLANIQQGAANQGQGLAGQVGQMQYGDKMNQYQNYRNTIDQQNKYSMDKYNNQVALNQNDKNAFGQALGLVGSVAGRML